MAAAKIDVVRVTTPEQMALSMAIRHEVFIVEQGYPERIEIGNPDDPISTHFVLYADEQPVGTIRVMPDGQLGRLAIRKSFRGMGLGKPLCVAVHEHVKSEGGPRVYCHSQAGDPKQGGVDATGFYRRLGYEPSGDYYMKEGTRHLNMVLDLSKTS